MPEEHCALNQGHKFSLVNCSSIHWNKPKSIEYILVMKLAHWILKKWGLNLSYISAVVWVHSVDGDAEEMRRREAAGPAQIRPAGLPASGPLRPVYRRLLRSHGTPLLTSTRRCLRLAPLSWTLALRCVALQLKVYTAKNMADVLTARRPSASSSTTRSRTPRQGQEVECCCLLSVLLSN